MADFEYLLEQMKGTIGYQLGAGEAQKAMAARIIELESKLGDALAAWEVTKGNEQEYLRRALTAENRLDSARELLRRASGRFGDVLERPGNGSSKLYKLIEDIADFVSTTSGTAPVRHVAGQAEAAHLCTCGRDDGTPCALHSPSVVERHDYIEDTQGYGKCAVCGSRDHVRHNPLSPE